MIFATQHRLSRADAAKLLGITTRTLDVWTQQGLRGVRLVASYCGGRVYYTERQLKDFQAAVDKRRASGAREVTRSERSTRRREERAAEKGLGRIYGRAPSPRNGEE